MFILYGVTDALVTREEIPVAVAKRYDVAGNLKVVASGKPTNLTGVTGDQVVKAVPGVLMKLVINATLNAAVVLKDGTTTFATIAAGTTARTLEYDAECVTSIIVNLANIADDITIIWI